MTKDNWKELCVEAGEEVRLCTRCEIIKPIAEMVKSKNLPLGVRPHCNSCRTAEAKLQNPNGRRRRGITDHGLTEEQYNIILNQQNGQCAICKSTDAGKNRNGNPARMAIDHDHSCCPGLYSCGKCVRGLLCGSCNRSFDRYEEFPEEMETYLHRSSVYKMERVMRTVKAALDLIPLQAIENGMQWIPSEIALHLLDQAKNQLEWLKTGGFAGEKP